MSKRPGNILLSHPVSGGGGWRVIPELSDDELRLIGLITTQWANLEHTLYEASNAFAEQLGITAHIDIEDISFDRRLRAFRDLAKVAPTRRRRAHQETFGLHRKSEGRPPQDHSRAMGLGQVQSRQADSPQLQAKVWL